MTAPSLRSRCSLAKCPVCAVYVKEIYTQNISLNCQLDNVSQYEGSTKLQQTTLLVMVISTEIIYRDYLHVEMYIPCYNFGNVSNAKQCMSVRSGV